jgi:hypothetical protein
VTCTLCANVALYQVPRTAKYYCGKHWQEAKTQTVAQARKAEQADLKELLWRKWPK